MMSLKRAGRPSPPFNRLPSGPATHFYRDPDRLCDSSSEAYPGDTPVTPVVRMFIDEQAPFEIDGDLYCVVRVFPSADGPQSDVLVLRGHEYMRCDERGILRAMQVRDLEALIDQDRVDIPFGGGARQWNLARGWCRGGRTLDSSASASAVPHRERFLEIQSLVVRRRLGSDLNELLTNRTPVRVP